MEHVVEHRPRLEPGERDGHAAGPQQGELLAA
jgi:hypothetical protein